MGCLVIMNTLYCIVHPSKSCMFRLLINNRPISNSCKGTSRVAGVHLVDLKKGIVQEFSSSLQRIDVCNLQESGMQTNRL